jgi:hypothetical protein
MTAIPLFLFLDLWCILVNKMDAFVKERPQRSIKLFSVYERMKY